MHIWVAVSCNQKNILKENWGGKKKQKTLAACLMDWLPLEKNPEKSGPDVTFPKNRLRAWWEAEETKVPAFKKVA